MWMRVGSTFALAQTLFHHEDPKLFLLFFNPVPSVFYSMKLVYYTYFEYCVFSFPGMPL